MLKKYILIWALFLAVLPGLCRAEIHIAVVAPRSNDYKTAGDELVRGAQIAVDEINASGGIKGKKLRLNSIDDACSENLAVSTAEMLAVGQNKKPALVVGPYCSDGFDKVARIYAKARIFQIVPTTLTARHVARLNKSPVKSVGFKEQAGRDFFEFYNRHYAGRKVALVFDNKDSNLVDLAAAVLEAFRRRGKASLLHNYEINSTNGNLEMLGAQIAAAEDIVVIMGDAGHTAGLINEVKRFNQDAIFVVGKNIVSKDFLENATSYLDSICFMALPSFEDNPDLAETLVKLRLKGIEFSGLNIYGYAAVQMWADLVDKAKSTAYDKVAAALQDKESESVWGALFFNNGSAENPLHYVFYRYENGEYAQIY